MSIEVIKTVCAGSRELNRKRILELEAITKTFPQVEIPVTHYIHGGMYCREITIPAGTIVTGQIYKFDHFDIMISGDVTVSTDGGDVKRFKGYNCLKGLSGKKRAGFAHEDTVWITIHPFSGEDGESIQKFVTAESFDELKLFNQTINKADYETFLTEICTTNEELKNYFFENEVDNKELEGVYVDNSTINGKGLFCKRKVIAGDELAVLKDGGKLTRAGRFVNHALLCNSKVIMNNGKAVLTSLRDLEIGDEITVNYREIVNSLMLKGEQWREL